MYEKYITIKYFILNFLGTYICFYMLKYLLINKVSSLEFKFLKYFIKKQKIHDNKKNILRMIKIHYDNVIERLPIFVLKSIKTLINTYTKTIKSYIFYNSPSIL